MVFLFVLENIRLPCDNPYSRKHNVCGLLLFMTDSEKAFDSVECSFIKKSLIKFNFGSSFTRWVPFFLFFFYCNINSGVSVNGHYSE